MIIPLNFPKVYDVQDPYEAMNVNLPDMLHWELAPSCAAKLKATGISFSLTTDGLKKLSEFKENLRKAIDRGFSESDALAALTIIPAQLIKQDKMFGTLDRGKYANFLITSGNLFDKETVIHENWVKGKPFILYPRNSRDLRGNYTLTVNGKELKLVVDGQLTLQKMTIHIDDTTKIKVKHRADGAVINIYYKEKEAGTTVRLSGLVENQAWVGRGQLSDGQWINWEAKYTGALELKDKKEKDKKDPVYGEVIYPHQAYGVNSIPAQETVMITNVTVWTNETEGILKNADVLITGGKIKAVGTGLDPGDAKVVDGSGKHLTSGIIDEHSHIAISRGVNECTQSVTAEVSIADVINSEDVNIYRQLSGGVTAAQLLHGSCNPIGGRSGIIKLRWGQSPEEMKIKNSDGFIKFALGENVKRSNAGDHVTNRFPQTRMGVEQVYYDAFIRAKEYEKARSRYEGLSSKDKAKTVPVREDIELNVLLEILNKKRFVTCHSYMQHEINMLMHVADSMGFRINTFTHILEGYKVADKMKEHGVGGSTFSDWWAYKFEVNEAIPYNGAIMDEMGVITAYNSDNAEMGRRLNQEAAKAVKYGGVSEEAALKFVTLNPAKLLHLDDRMGSIRVGKDADIVLWSDHPLSVYAKVEQTYVDGRLYFDLIKDQEMRDWMKKERNRLVQKMLDAKKSGDKTQKPIKKEERLYHCDDVGE
ncbi:MAG: amidohydrolase family protein [Bacteroidetes bacterium]|nr:amidohydrolase family protein [Bacteroidota bacterium]